MISTGLVDDFLCAKRNLKDVMAAVPADCMTEDGAQRLLNATNELVRLRALIDKELQ